MNIVLKRIRKRLKKTNQNFLGVICGQTGSGKSYSALTICKEIDPSFDIDRVTFTPEQFMELLNSGKLKKGNMILFDEAGVGMPAREWMRISNKVLSYVLQTFRHENLGIIFTVPSFDFVDVQLRKLFHAYMETLVINYREKWCKIKYMEMQYNPKYGKIYYKYPRCYMNGKIVVIKALKIPKPPQDLINKYEKKKKRFTSHLKKDAETIIKKTKKKETANALCKKCGYMWYTQAKTMVRCPRCSSPRVDVRPQGF